MSDQEIYVAKRAAYLTAAGRTVLVRTGTTVRAGHPLLADYPDLFEPIRVQYDVDATTETRAATAKSTGGKKSTETR